MENTLIWLFITFTFGSIITVKSSACVPTENCNCYRWSQHTEYQCWFRKYETNLKVHPKEVILACDTNLTYDLDILPKIDAKNVQYLKISRCRHPNFSALSDMLNVTNVTELVFEGLICSKRVCYNVSLTKDLFKDLNNVLYMVVRDVSLTLEDDFLVNTPNLETLKLPRNYIEEIGYIFNYTPRLTYIDLSSNKLSGLPDKVFSSLPNLQKLILSRNSLTKLGEDTFKGVTKLVKLDLSFNRIHDLPIVIFSNLTNLKELNLMYNNLSRLENGLFGNNIALEKVVMSDNPYLIPTDYLFADKQKLEIVNIDRCNMNVLPEHIFKSSIHLREISLSHNHLRSIPQKLFSGLTYLTRINLSHNDIVHITENLFMDLKNLKVLNLHQNKISNIEPNSFSKLTELLKIYMSGNKLNSDIFDYQLNYNQNLIHIDLGSNDFIRFPHNVVLGKRQLQLVNLEDNSIDTLQMSDFLGSVSTQRLQINLSKSKNNLTLISFKDAMDLFKSSDLHYTIVNLNDNTIECDCFMYNLTRFIHDRLNYDLQTRIYIRHDKLKCANFVDQVFISDIQPGDLSCPVSYSQGCPNECFCSWRPHDQSVVVDCSDRNLENIPQIHSGGFHDIYVRQEFAFNQTIVDLRGNKLIGGPTEISGYDNVTNLDLSNNQLTHLQWMPPRLEVLHLDHNNFESLNKSTLDILKEIKTLQKITLLENPWVCDCSADNLQKFLKLFYQKVSAKEVICAETKEALVDIKYICPFPATMVVAITIILIFVSVFVTMLAIYYRYEKQIKIYLFAKNLCLWFIAEDDLDKDKIYDVFLCYSHKDEPFVIKNILAELESKPRPYKVCVHVRDFIPGELIATQVRESIRDSKRTLIILSNSFLESDWCQMEFTCALSQTVIDGMARMVTVIYGDLNEELLDNKVKTYLKANTYVKWGDPWFWQKLRYALPHSRCGFYDEVIAPLNR